MKDLVGREIFSHIVYTHIRGAHRGIGGPSRAHGVPCEFTFDNSLCAPYIVRGIVLGMREIYGIHTSVRFDFDSSNRVDISNVTRSIRARESIENDRKDEENANVLPRSLVARSIFVSFEFPIAAPRSPRRADTVISLPPLIVALIQCVFNCI